MKIPEKKNKNKNKKPKKTPLQVNITNAIEYIKYAII